MSAGPPSRSRTRSATRARRLGVLGLLLVLLASRVAVELHWAAVRHAVCHEHGELVEVPAHGDAHGDAQSNAPVVLPAPGEGHSHEHCLLAAASREHPLADASAQRLQAAPAAPGVQPTADPSQPWQPFARYLLAPHTSPPA